MENQYPNEDYGYSNAKSQSSGKLGWGILIGIFGTMLIVVTTLAILIKLEVVNIGGRAVSDSSDALADRLYKKMQLIEGRMGAFYFDEADEQKIIDDMCSAYLAAYGDKYTVYYNSEDYKELNQEATGSYVGIGVLVSLREDGTIKAERVYPNSPAEKVGMRDGDIIIAVAGKTVVGRELDDVVSDIRGDAGTSVKVTIKRGDKEIEYDIVREEVDYIMVEGEMLDNEMGYIAISQFSNVTYKQFRDCYNKLLEEGAKGIVIDVRGNPGGLVTSVCDVLDMLVPDGTLMYMEDKRGTTTTYKSKNHEEADIPLVVLVDENSASAAEVFAGGMQDYKKATIVGTTTFGKGIVQTIMPLGDGTAVKLTTAKYFTGKGQDVHGKGIKPDIEIEFDYDSVDWESDELGVEDDNQLVKAMEVLRQQMK